MDIFEWFHHHRRSPPAAVATAATDILWNFFEVSAMN